jgi:hypothetical protein
MSQSNHHPEHHVNEEPRNDFEDTLKGFSTSFGIFFLIALFATILKLAIS